MSDRIVEDILERLDRCRPEQRLRVFTKLREEFPIHTIEATFGVPAEVILEAIHRASDLSQRGMRGLIAEAEFGTSVAKRLAGWSTSALQGDFLYDYELTDATGPVRVQVKQQRREKGVPKLVNGMFVVETQKTRGGKTAQDEKTRPYRFGDFDVLAVCMEASTNRWSDFMYTVERWLVPQPADKACLLTYQYIPQSPNADWTADFLEVVAWFRSAEKKEIAGRALTSKFTKTKQSATSTTAAAPGRLVKKNTSDTANSDTDD